MTNEDIRRAAAEMLRYGNGYGKFTSAGFQFFPREAVHAPPQHGAIDYRRRPDGVWEMPK